MARPPANALRVLLARAIDYAGLYPPAHLGMAEACAAYDSYLRSDDAWALGRFVVPASRLGELAGTCARANGSDASPRWRLSAVLGSDVDAELARVREFNDRFAGAGAFSATVEAVELRAAEPAGAKRAVAAAGSGLECYVEIPVADDPDLLVRTIGAAGGRAKVRTGGTTADAIPPSGQVIRFLARCVEARVPFKATAGLHHPLRGDYALTYAPDSARGTMFGFLNVFLATALLFAGHGESVALKALEEQSAKAISFHEDGIAWREHQLTRDHLAAARSLAIVSFGSCSFREPLDDLAALRLA